MKKSVIILLVLICALAVISCGRSGAQTEAAQPIEQPVQEQTPVQAVEAAPIEQQMTASMVETQPQQPVQEQQAPVQEASTGCIVEANGIKFEVTSASIEQAYNGENIAVVRGIYTNSNAAGDSYWNVITDSASQNGTGLGVDVVVDYEKIATATQVVGNGQSVPIYLAYQLLDPNAPITVNISIFNDRPTNVLASGSCTLNFS